MDRAVFDRMAELDQRPLVVHRAPAHPGGGDPARSCGRRQGARILEIGCGTGHNLEMLGAVRRRSRRASSTTMRASSPASALGGRWSSAALPDLSMFPADSYDMVALLDVLEHVADDKGSLAAIFTRLKPGGALLLTVPANPWMWSAHDVAHHHHRRYRKREIASAGEGRGLRDRPAVAVQHHAVPADRRGAGDRQGARARSADDAMPPKPVNAILDRLFGAEAGLIGRVPMPFGVSLVAVLRRPAAALEQQRAFDAAHRLPARDPRARDRRHVDQPQIIERVARRLRAAEFDRHALAAAAFGAHDARRIALEPARCGVGSASAGSTRRAAIGRCRSLRGGRSPSTADGRCGGSPSPARRPHQRDHARAHRHCVEHAQLALLMLGGDGEAGGGAGGADEQEGDPANAKILASG